MLVTAEGLVGKVWKLGDESSIAIDWTHDRFAVAVMTVEGETYGIAKPVDGPHGERVLALTPVAFHTVPDTGSLVVTSGDGALFPRGIPVGQVIGEGKEPGGWQRTYFIRPLVNPSQMSHVLVLGAPMQGRSDQDLASAWGVRLTQAQVADTSARAVAPDAATPMARPARARRRPTPRPRPRPRRRDPTPELPGSPSSPPRDACAPEQNREREQERGMMEGTRWRFALFIAGLVVLHFVLRVGLGLGVLAPDLLVVALLLASRRMRPGGAAGSASCWGCWRARPTPRCSGRPRWRSRVVGYLGSRSREWLAGDDPVTMVPTSSWARCCTRRCSTCCWR